MNVFIIHISMNWCRYVVMYKSLKPKDQRKGHTSYAVSIHTYCNQCRWINLVSSRNIQKWLSGLRVVGRKQAKFPSQRTRMLRNRAVLVVSRCFQNLIYTSWSLLLFIFLVYFPSFTLLFYFPIHPFSFFHDIFPTS